MSAKVGWASARKEGPGIAAARRAGRRGENRGGVHPWLLGSGVEPGARDDGACYVALDGRGCGASGMAAQEPWAEELVSDFVIGK